MTQRLANALGSRPSSAIETTAGGSQPGGAATDIAAADGFVGVEGGEAGSVRRTCDGMASRLAELDPMHKRFYEFVRRGGSVWGMGEAFSRQGGEGGFQAEGGGDL